MTMPGGSMDRSANVTLNANVDPFVKSLTQANQLTLKLGDALKKLDDTIVKIGKRAGAGAMAMGGAGLLSAFGNVKQAAELEKAYESLSAQAVRTGESMGEIQRGVRDLTTQIPVAKRELVGMATAVAALGIQGTQNIVRFTRASEELAKATNTAPGQLFTQLTEMGRAMGNNLASIERYGSVLTDLQAKMGVSADSITTFAGGIQAVGNKAGVTEAQLLGLSAAFQKVGADGFAGAQAFNTVINDLVEAVDRNSPRLQSYANLLGVTSQAMGEMVKNNPAEAFVRFVEAVSQQGSRASQVLQQFGLDGVRTQRVFAALTGGQADLRGALALSNQAYRENSATSQAAAAAWDGYSDSIVRLKNEFANIGDEIGRPFLKVLQPITEGFTKVMHTVSGLVTYLNDAPWPIGDTISVLATKGPALLLVAGAFTVLAASLVKFLGIWRMASGQLGINIFRGMSDGLRHQLPREMEGASRSAMSLYQRAYGMTSGGATQVGGMARRSMVGQVGMFPVTRARQIFGDAFNTMAHPLNPDRRSIARTDPFSMYGMYQRGAVQAGQARTALQTRLLASQDPWQRTLGARLQTGFGDPDDSAQRLRQDRLRVTEDARIRASQMQREVNSNLSRAQRVQLLATAETAQFGDRANFQPTNFAAMSGRQLSRQLGRQANWIGGLAASTAGKQFDGQLSNKETALLAGPFEKLAKRIKGLGMEIPTQIGTSIKTAMSSIEAFFRQATSKIIQMAQTAQAELLKMHAAATGTVVTPHVSRVPSSLIPVPPPPVTSAPTVVTMTSLPPVPGANMATTPGMVSLGGRRSPVDSDAVARGAVIAPPGMLGTLGRSTTENVAAGRPAGFVGGEGQRAGAFSKLLNSSEKLSRAYETSILQVRAFGASAAQAGLGVVKGLGALISGPWLLMAALFGPMLYSLGKKFIDSLHKISTEMDYTGAEMAKALGRDFTTPQERRDKERNTATADDDPFGTSERKDASSGDFHKQYQRTLAQLDSTTSAVSAQARLQMEINRNVQQNNGKPLDEAQKRELRQLIMASGLDTSVYDKLDLTGARESGFYSSAIKDYNVQENKFTGGTRAGLSTNAITDYMQNGPASLAYVLGGTDTAFRDGGGMNRQERLRYSDLSEQVINDYNKQNPNATIGGFSGSGVTTFQSFLDKLGLYGEGSPAAHLKDQLEGLGLVFDQTGQLTAESLQKLASAAGESASAMATDHDTLGVKLGGTRLETAFDAISGKSDGFATSFLANPEARDFQLKIMQLEQQLGAEDPSRVQPTGQTIYNSDANDILRRRIDLIREYKDVINDPTDVAWQQLDALEKKQLAALQNWNTLNLSPANALRQQVQTMNSIIGTGVTETNAADVQTQIDQTESQINTGISALRSYYVQIRDMQRSLQRGAEDHNRQMAKMDRDRNIQIAEANYQNSEQQRQALWSFQDQQRQAAYSYSESLRSMKYSIATSFGNPAQMVQAQYTQGASGAMVGMDRQVEYLKRAQEAMNTLQRQGLSGDAIKLLGLDKPENFAQAERWVKDFAEDPRLVAQFNKSIAERLSISGALATNPGNSEFTELNRQFEHSADEAKRAFDHAAEESAKAFAHTMQISAESYDRSMADYVESYDISVSRTMQDMSRLGEDTFIGMDKLLQWAKNSGIQGVMDYADAVTAAIDSVSKAMQKMQLKLVMDQLATQWGKIFGPLGGLVPKKKGPGIGLPNPFNPQGETYGDYPTNGIPGIPGASGSSSGGKFGGGTFLKNLGGQMGDSLGGAIAAGLTTQLGTVFDSLGDKSSKLRERFDASSKVADKWNEKLKASKTDMDNLDARLLKVPKSVIALDKSLGANQTQMKLTQLAAMRLTEAINDIPKNPTIVFTAVTKEAIGAVSKMMHSMSDSVSGLITNVLSGGLLGAWNYVINSLGLPGNLVVNAIKWKGYAAGGYTGDGGKHEAKGVVHGGEFVVTKEKTAKHRPFLEALHRGEFDGMPGYLDGGYVAMSNVIKKQFPWSRITSDYRPGDPGYHGKGQAIDVAGATPYPNSAGMAQMMEINRWIAGAFSNITELIHTAPGAINLWHGKPHTYNASTQAEHRNHVHWADDGSGTGGSSLMANPMEFIRNAVLKSSKGLSSQPAGAMLSAIPSKLLEHMSGWIDGFLAKFATSYDTPTAPIAGGSNVDIVRAIAAQRGWGSGSQWDALYQLVNHESSFRNTAQNPSSSAYGLFQFLDSTWKGTGYNKTSDPSIQTQAGLKYVSQRYGTPQNAWDFWQRNHWYGNGGVFDKAQMIGVGEAGPETVLPLNATGAQFVAQTLRASLQMMGVGPSIADIRRQRTSGYTSQARSEMSYHHTDASTNFTGPVTVVSQDPNEMSRKLKEKARLANLNRPGART